MHPAKRAPPSALPRPERAHAQPGSELQCGLLPPSASCFPAHPSPQVSFRDVNLTLFPSPICSPDVVAGRIRQLQLFTGLDNSSVWGEGLIGHFHNFRQGGGQERRARAGEVQA